MWCLVVLATDINSHKNKDSIMHSINIDTDKLKSIARTLLSELEKRDAIISGKKANYNACLQMASMGIFNKPYEEVKALLTSGAHTKATPVSMYHISDIQVVPSHNVNEDTVPRVMMFHDGDEYVISLDGKFFSAQFKGGVHELNDEEIFEKARAAAQVTECVVPVVHHLPPVLAENSDYDAAIDLAEKMGYFKYKRTLLDLLDDPDTNVFINGNYIHDKLNGDYRLEMEEADDPYEHCIWMPEWQVGHEQFEMYISFDEICSALPVDGDVSKWTLGYQGRDFIIEVR